MQQQKQWELFDNHVAKKKQEQLQLGHYLVIYRKCCWTLPLYGNSEERTKPKAEVF